MRSYIKGRWQPRHQCESFHWSIIYTVLMTFVATLRIYGIASRNFINTSMAYTARMIPGLRQLSYAKRLESLNLWSLEERRNRFDLLEVFRMYKGWYSFSSMCTLSNNTVTRGHTAKIMKNRCRLDLRCHFFSVRVTDRWNRLPHAGCSKSSTRRPSTPSSLGLTE